MIWIDFGQNIKEKNIRQKSYFITLSLYEMLQIKIQFAFVIYFIKMTKTEFQCFIFQRRLLAVFFKMEGKVNLFIDLV